MCQGNKDLASKIAIWAPHKQLLSRPDLNWSYTELALNCKVTFLINENIIKTNPFFGKRITCKLDSGDHPCGKNKFKLNRTIQFSHVLFSEVP